MTEYRYTYVECDGCSKEERMVASQYPYSGSDLSPPGWLRVDNRDREKLWDLCSECAKAFTAWLLERNGVVPKVESERPHKTLTAKAQTRVDELIETYKADR